jgi:hypothetical protein
MRAGLVIEKPMGGFVSGFELDFDDHIGALLIGTDGFDRIFLCIGNATRQ